MARQKSGKDQKAGPATGAVEAVRHQDQRTNIPTRELRGFEKAWWVAVYGGADS